MRIVHSMIPYTFSNLQVQFHAGHGHKHPFLVIEQGEHKLHTKTERLHGELATWDGEYSLQVESKADVSAGTPFRIVVHEHHTVAPDQAIAEGTFVVTANIAGPQQVSVVLANKKGYQKGTAVFVLNIGNRTEVWGSPVNSPRMQSQSMFMAQGPLADSAPAGYAAAQPMMMQQSYAPVQQMYASQAGSISPSHSRMQSGSPPPHHSLLPQGRGSIVYQQGSYSQGMQQGASSSSSFSSSQQGVPAGYPQRTSSPMVTQQMYSQAPPSLPPGPLASGGAPALGQQYFEYIEDRPVTKEVITYVQERRPIAKQYVVETRFTGQEHEVAGGAQQQVVGHQERIIPGPPPGISAPPPVIAPPQVVVMQQQQQPVNMVYTQQQQQHHQQQPPSPSKHHHSWSLFGHAKQQGSASSQGQGQRGIPAAMSASSMQQMAGPTVGQQYFNVVESLVGFSFPPHTHAAMLASIVQQWQDLSLAAILQSCSANSMQQMAGPAVGQQNLAVVEERPVMKQVVDYVQERHPVAKQYVTETRFTGQEYEMRGAGQQQVVGHEERIIGAPPVNFCNSDLCM